MRATTPAGTPAGTPARAPGTSPDGTPAPTPAVTPDGTPASTSTSRRPSLPTATARTRAGRRSALLLLAVLAAGCSSADPVSRPAPEPSPSAASRAPAFESHQEVAARRPAPVRLRIPSLQVDAPVGPVSTLADGTIDVPDRWEDVGWYDGGARPGEDGPAVLLGHVDSKAGPAVFVRLPDVQVGAVVEVLDAEGGTTRFAVDRVEQHPKTRFPTEAVYLPVLRPELRLVTCGGAFDRATGHYVDNIVVYASPLA